MPKKTASERLKEIDAKHAERRKRLEAQAKVDAAKAELNKLKKK